MKETDEPNKQVIIFTGALFVEPSLKNLPGGHRDGLKTAESTKGFPLGVLILTRSFTICEGSENYL